MTSAAAYAVSPHLLGSDVPKLWNRTATRPLFGDLVLLAFLVAQGCDGIFTYLGICVYGPAIEANPLIGTLIDEFGHGPALTATKSAAAAFGIALHLGRAHKVVAILTAIYVVAALIPWALILFA